MICYTQFEVLAAASAGVGIVPEVYVHVRRNLLIISDLQESEVRSQICEADNCCPALLAEHVGRVRNTEG